MSLEDSELEWQRPFNERNMARADCRTPFYALFYWKPSNKIRTNLSAAFESVQDEALNLEKASNILHSQNDTIHASVTLFLSV